MIFWLKIIDYFFDSVHERFVPGGNLKVQGYVELKNCQRTAAVKLENTRVWPTNVYIGTLGVKWKETS